jgi:hypothetical protein
MGAFVPSIVPHFLITSGGIALRLWIPPYITRHNIKAESRCLCTCASDMGRQTRQLVTVLENGGNALATTNAHRNERPFFLFALEPIERLDGQDGSGGPNGMAQGNRSAIRVDPLGVQFRLTHNRQDLGREGLIQLDHIQVTGFHAHRRQDTADGIDGHDAHNFRFVAGDCCRRHAHEWLPSLCTSLLLGH